MFRPTLTLSRGCVRSWPLLTGCRIRGQAHPPTGARIFSNGKVSRTERRLLQKKQRNKEKREQTRTARVSQEREEAVLAPMSKIRERMMRLFYPQTPGSGTYFGWDHLASLGYRLPLCFALCYALTNDDTSPFVVQGSLGPSMLPTIRFIGDLWLVETGAWHRLLGWNLPLQKGDVVLWRDPDTGRVSCKRVIGVEGDVVKRYGQYAQTYQNRDDWAIVWPRDATERNLDKTSTWDPEHHIKDIHRTLEVPKDYIWLEGDCPPFSLDSRHYGPIPVGWVRGRLILRVWPLEQEDENGDPVSKWVGRDRPIPFPSLDEYLGKRFNFYRVPREDKDANLE